MRNCLLALLELFTNWNFPILSYTSTSKFHTLLYSNDISEAGKRYLFRAEPPRIGHYREYQPPLPTPTVYSSMKTDQVLFLNFRILRCWAWRQRKCARRSLLPPERTSLHYLQQRDVQNRKRGSYLSSQLACLWEICKRRLWWKAKRRIGTCNHQLWSVMI